MLTIKELKTIKTIKEINKLIEKLNESISITSQIIIYKELKDKDIYELDKTYREINQIIFKIENIKDKYIIENNYNKIKSKEISIDDLFNLEIY